MKRIISEKQYRVNLESFQLRRRYMERVIATLNNELCEDGLSPSERVKLYGALNAAVKIVNDSQRDSKIEEIEYRISALEKEKKNVS